MPPYIYYTFYFSNNLQIYYPKNLILNKIPKGGECIIMTCSILNGPCAHEKEVCLKDCELLKVYNDFKSKSNLLAKDREGKCECIYCKKLYDIDHVFPMVGNPSRGICFNCY